MSTRDIMDPTICPNCDGFENVDNRIQNSRCGRNRQNSYQMMQDRLGIWTGGIKPTPFGCQDDRVMPLVQILAPAPNATVGDSFALRVQASDDCRVSRVTVTVAPMGLTTQSTTAPFEWTLTKISGRQIITVTAVDPSGKQSSASVTVNAPGGSGQGSDGGMGTADGAPGLADTDPGAGCNVAGCDIAGPGHAGSATWWGAMFTLLTVMTIVLASTRRESRRNSPSQRSPRLR